MLDSTRFEGRFENGLLMDAAALVKPQIGGEVRLPMEMADAGVAPSDVPATTPGTPRIKVSAACLPQYPPAAMRTLAVGSSGFSLLVGPDSQVRRVRWFHRSGTDFTHQLLDLTAIASLLNCAILPGTVDGRPAERWMPVEYVWKIE
jgi:hypothetical protein